MHSLEKLWYRLSPLHLVLWPVSLLFWALSAARRRLYRAGLLRVTRLPVPVVIVGNITIGGTGKTPLVIAIAQWLREHGHHPGIISRGYRGDTTTPRAAGAKSDPREVGDEAVLLARRAACPVWVGKARVATGRALLATHPDCDVIISDDGLQHYALAREVEIAVLDGARGCGNGMLLPAGPMREPVTRLNVADALVINGGALFTTLGLPATVPEFDMQLEGDTFYNLSNAGCSVTATHFAESQVHACAGIGNPRRFFDQLRELGIRFTAHPFPDHHAFAPPDVQFPECESVLMTEKDAVKCERFANLNFWALRVDAKVDPALFELILRKIGKSMDPKLLDLLVCPICKGPLVYDKAKQELTCKPDRLAYPVKDGIPVMLEDEARKLPPQEEV